MKPSNLRRIILFTAFFTWYSLSAYSTGMDSLKIISMSCGASYNVGNGSKPVVLEINKKIRISSIDDFKGGLTFYDKYNGEIEVEILSNKQNIMIYAPQNTFADLLTGVLGILGVRSSRKEYDIDNKSIKYASLLWNGEKKFDDFNMNYFPKYFYGYMGYINWGNDTILYPKKYSINDSCYFEFISAENKTVRKIASQNNKMVINPKLLFNDIPMDKLDSLDLILAYKYGNKIDTITKSPFKLIYLPAKINTLKNQHYSPHQIEDILEVELIGSQIPLNQLPKEQREKLTNIERSLHELVESKFVK